LNLVREEWDLVVGGEKRAPGNSWGSRVVPPGNDGNVKESIVRETGYNGEESPGRKKRIEDEEDLKGEEVQEEREGRREEREG
jgi:hypothetical protein